MENREKLYVKLATDIEKQIKAGLLKTGEKVISVRKQSAVSGLSINTVLQAYLLLEKRGLIEARAQSGFYIAAPATTEAVRPENLTQTKAAPVQIPDIVSDLFEAANNDKIVPLGAACFSPELYPNEAVARIMRSILRTEKDVNSKYQFPPGHPRFTQQVAKRLSRTGNRIRTEEVYATNGALESVHLALRAVLKPGDTLLIESPNYFGILQAVASLGVKVIEISADSKTGVDPDEFHSLLKKHKISAALLMPNFNNPLGSLMPDESKRSIVKMISHYGIPVIEDDVYADLAFSGIRPKLLRAFDDEGLVISCSSFSKTISPAARVGWALPGKFEKQFRNIQLSSTVGTNRPQQLVMAEFLSSGAYERHLKHILPLMQTQVYKMTEAVLRYFPEGTRLTQPGAGFMLWVELPRGHNSIDLYHAAAAKKISIAPGVIFSAHGKYKNYIRINCGRIWTPEIENAVKTLGLLLKR
ncbi:PLP-dependent aminotransferase family protein [Bdellovibrio sp. HCB2-146]|uniref:aminotransferase-like domain-containing protein n=1 Tax=Bdellovibrio sp. HCB2-146 TaxID=3394362 RepID=UPI0039BC3DAD